MFYHALGIFPEAAWEKETGKSCQEAGTVAGSRRGEKNRGKRKVALVLLLFMC